MCVCECIYIYIINPHKSFWAHRFLQAPLTCATPSRSTRTSYTTRQATYARSQAMGFCGVREMENTQIGWCLMFIMENPIYFSGWLGIPLWLRKSLYEIFLQPWYFINLWGSPKLDKFPGNSRWGRRRAWRLDNPTSTGPPKGSQGRGAWPGLVTQVPSLTDFPLEDISLLGSNKSPPGFRIPKSHLQN